MEHKFIILSINVVYCDIITPFSNTHTHTQTCIVFIVNNNYHDNNHHRSSFIHINNK